MKTVYQGHTTTRQSLKITRLPGQEEPNRRRTIMAYKKFTSVTKGSDFMNTQRPPRKWAVAGLIPEGLSFIAAGKSVGKSWLALNIALAIAEGKPTLGQIATRQGPVLYLSLEDDEKLLEERLRMLGADPCPPDLNLVFDGDEFQETLRERSLLERLEGWYEDNPEARLIIIDMMAKILPMMKSTADRYGNEYRFSDQFKVLAQRLSIPILILHHTNQRGKEQLSDDFDKMSGTTGLMGPAMGVILLERQRFERRLVASVTGKGIQEHKYELERDDNWHMTLLGDAPKKQVTPALADVLNLTKEVKTLTIPYVADRLKIQPDAAGKRLQRLEGEYLTRIADGVYVLSATAADLP